MRARDRRIQLVDRAGWEVAMASGVPFALPRREPHRTRITIRRAGPQRPGITYTDTM